MWNRLCFILAVLSAIQATTIRKKRSRVERQAYYNSGINNNYVWNTPVDVEFVLDSSDTVGADNFRYMIQYVQNLVRHWEIGPQRIQVGVVTYGNGARNQFYFNNYQTGAQLVNAIGNIQYQSGAADLGNAFRFAYGDAFTSQHGSRDHVPHVIVHIGNGVSSNKAFTLQEAQAARDHGVAIYNVAVGSGVDTNEIQNIATSPASRYVLHADTYQSLDTLVNPLATKIENEVPGSNTMLPQPNGCLQKADLVFMIDSSSNVGIAQHQQLENFLKNFLIRLPVGKDKVQVGLIQYSSYPSAGFPLSMYTDRNDLLKAVDSLRYMGGGTNTADALKYMREQTFSQTSGARTDVPRIGIVITNGHSSNPTATTTEADKARSSNIGLIGVGVGSGLDLNELNNIADNPHTSNTFTISDYDQLQNSIPQILNAACNINRMVPGHTGGQGVTHPPDTCQDKLTNCHEYEKSACVDYKSWATENCARYCQICTPQFTVTEECKDKLDNCKMYAADTCQSFGPWAHTNCRQYCGFCGDFSAGFFGQCFYKGKAYKQGDRWDDGCDYECVCENGNTGKYRCYNKCPIYNDLPGQCTLVATPGQCCLKPVCNFQQKVTTNTGSGLGKTPTGISVCVYDGKQYYQDESWEVGCDFKCSCINAQRGVYSCQSYCPTYSNLPSSCHLVKSPGQCCETPSCDFNQQVGSFTGSGTTSGTGSSNKPKEPLPCEDVLTNCNMYEASSCKDPFRQWAIDNCRKTCNLCENGLSKPGPNDVCFYQGKPYHQDEAWSISCDVDCVCEQATFGYYRCSNKCPSYINIPNGCYTKKKTGDCCETVVCDRGSFVPSTTNLKSIGNGGGIIVTGLGGSQINVPPTFPSGATPGPGSGGTGMQAPTLNGCLYSGNLYVQGQQWTDGCQQTCVCTDATKGLYKCRARCPSYQGIPQNCIMKADPNDPCCKIPGCNPLTGQLPIPVYGPNVQNIGAVQPPSIGDLISGTFTVKHSINFNGGTVAPPTAPAVVPTGSGIGYCMYKGQRYAQSQTWQDGCDYNCVCQDATVGKWKCNERCMKYENLPQPYCKLIPDTANPCCKVPHCDFTGKYGELFGTLTRPPVTQPATQYPQTLPVITTPAPAFCDYKGQKYNQGQMWYDACSLKCTCDNARAGYYRCVNRCPQYDNVPADCSMVPDPQDPMCCTVPKCMFGSTSGGTSGQGNIPVLSPGNFNNQNPGGKPSGVGYCEYKGTRYQQGDKWQDGCQLKCECQDEDSGLYKCTERCPRFPDMPPQCTLIPDFTDPCCKKPSCDFTGTSGSLSGHGNLNTPPPGYFTPSPGYTGTPIPAYCVYNGAKYFQGATWNDGCDKQCRCEDSVKGLYVCNDRCPAYDNLPPECSFVTDPKDQCCRIPSCQFVPTQGQITGTLSPNMIPTAVPGKITGQVPTPTPGPDGKTPSPINHCIYKSHVYQQGQEWEDGCTYHCTCQDALNGKYVCKEKCARYNNLPPQCTLVKDASNPCCMTPDCIFSGTNGQISGSGQITPKPNVTPSPGSGATPNPNVRPTPKLPKSVCIYRGQPYTQSQTWFDGCTYKCVCENADQGVYRCDNRCPTWDKLPSECSLVADPKDPFCCTVPKCDFHPHSGNITGFVLPSVAPGTINGGAVIPTPGPNVTPNPHPGVSPSPGFYPQYTPAPFPQGVCVYKGKTYQNGEQWQDGCDYNCACLDAAGRYKCTERCPRFGSIPSQCRMVQDVYNPCCEKPYCDFTPGHGSVSGTGLPGVSPNASPIPKKMCVYNGVAYDKDQTWNDGCQLKCTCEDSVKGVYRCDQRCARYDTVPEGCRLTTSQSDSCCRVPYCSPIPNTNPTPGQVTYAPGVSPSIQPTYGPGINPNIIATPKPYLFPTAPPGKITGQTVNNPDKNKPQNTSVCLYNNVVYTQGQTWTDGCDYQCECTDQHNGKYTCTERCSVFLNPPPFCVMAVDPNDNCCKKPICNPLTGLTPSPQNTPAPTPGISVAPGVSPTPGTGGVLPTPTGVCVYQGTSYVQGQQWYDGCTKSCICENGKTGFYRCSDRCAKYDNVPQQCRMVADPKDPQCCQVPECTPTPGPNGYPTPVPGVSPTPSVVTNVPGFVTGVAPTPTPGPDGKTPAPTLACIYKGHTYRQGERWQDGCQYNCVCEDEVTGKYKCNERCAKYPFIPPQCSLRRDTDTDFCCYKMVCDFSKPTINPFQTPTPGPNQTPGPNVTPNPNQTPGPVANFCMYKGVPYRQGQEWTEGCLQRCRCDDASRNYYTCFNRCPSYNLPPSTTCTQDVDPNDACCRIPHCVQTPTPSPNVGPSSNPNVNPTPNPYPQPTIIPHGTIGGENANKNPLTNQGFCIYKGQMYKQGDRWQDGCDYNCECVDEKSGKYTCTERCNKIASIPAYCNVIQDPYDTCCKKPDCPTLSALVTTPRPNPAATHTPKPPNAFSTPGPQGTPTPKNACVYKGQPYTQGQQFFDGCNKKCVCDDSSSGHYSCVDRCPSYPSIAPNCVMVPDPLDPTCCQAPQCNNQPHQTPSGIQGTITGYGKPPTPAPQATPVPGGITPTPGDHQQPTPASGCVYKGKLYTPGQRWADGCDYTCVCEDGMTGKYQCTEKCPKYPNMAPGCRMIADFTNPCCMKPDCSAPTPGPTIKPPLGQTPAPTSSPPINPSLDFCVYNGVPIKQGQTVNVGCDKVCSCEDAKTGQINCDDRCATYPQLKPGCTMITDPNDACCQIPKCNSPNTNGNQHILTGMPGSITGQSLPPSNPNPLTKTTGCMYHGRTYTQGQTWDDGCTYTCECLDDHSGKYKCNEKCAKTPNVPASCSLIQDLKNKCCRVVYCPTIVPTQTVLQPTPYPIGYTPYPGATPYPGPSLYPIGQTPSPGATPYLGPTPYPIGYTPLPGATPYPGPSKYPIGYTPYPGATPYLGPTPYPIGYVPFPGATPYPGPSKYPIGATPYPGATPYLGPTPYPIGYTPFPGATPYPGPSKYPIGYTPLPGATPYLGPTPYPIGYTPYPGATPYPGPSKYPIGYTPSPGATPYLGPTPYPIGYTPYPYATPYPGPSQYPIGYTPYPGATPYLGPTPYPIGYTPYPSATPYPGPSKYPIGYTPSPGATPYVGPTPYPIGYTPWPGATPYPGPTPYPIGYTPSPGATPYPGLSIHPIGYTPFPGATPYLGPTPWPVGYTPWPYATPYPGPSRYPIGYTPSPGATPYLGPTPYKIGYIPFPGATPYPGPSKYPIGYTPSPGATPYLGPTPWKIGYTPSPGATPYPGPSKYPIGYIPYPGATPYLGPTPYPIGYTPYPSATPYPGPTRYPIGYTPSPGATPYVGPTPYPIGYTPWPGATPYPGPTPYPIGYTPSPGATPYPGPSIHPIGYTPFPGATPYLGPTPWPVGYTPYPSATPYPGPSKYPIGYTPSPGATPYLGPTPWPIGYTPWPSATPYPGPNRYPIGYTPSPGATPYLGPTPYPIGYTPWPGATPYPGPSKYPIGATPYPGATPYLGPTPWPIGYTPSPGATPYLGPTPVPIGYTPYPGAIPYAGPSKYPIGYTPSPGANPYLGPTPYPIGFVPSPGATPYPGPSRYPIGSIPFPGGTPYYGPTPYPIGFIPSQGATPYPGPSKMPIGYTPFPGATPYLGPTPWPIGFTPSPGATPYPGPSRYPIGYIPPYPGATPYAGPTPWPVGYTVQPGGTPYPGRTPYPIGYTPWPGATPYPGPNKYPIGYTPSPGATPYLGPTPYSIGYTPSLGVTPYPGPSKYPIGYTPYPGATKYAGPTPWPIGYTPSPGATPYPGRTINPFSTPYPVGVTPWPGATPYPGPSIWPIGITPYPGATVYLGPTPWPIGYTVRYGGTPYPGPSKYPLGATPFPGATPYLGPTPYPIGYTPWPGATPYPGPTLPPGYTVQPTPGPTPVPRPKGMCVYKNQYYHEQQTWYDGCTKTCRCESGDTGDVRCQDRCAKYSMAPNCMLMPDPKDPSCCEVPSCPLVPSGATPTPGYIHVTGKPGVISGNGPVKPVTPGPTVYPYFTPGPTPSHNPNATPAPKAGCMYKGRVYKQGEKWDDGCDYSCECLDDHSGQYLCSEKCLRVPNLPQRCVLLPDPNNKCCKTPYCDFLNPTPFPGGIPTPSPVQNPSLAPGQTTPGTPGIGTTPLSANHNNNVNVGMCVYKGSFYRQGDRWTDGCDKSCVCDDAAIQRYTCRERCKSFGSVPAGCVMKTNPQDSCCLVPDCTKLPLVPIAVTPGTGVGPSGSNIPPHTTYGSGTGIGITPHTGTGPSGSNAPGVSPWYGPGFTGYVVPTGIPGTFSGTSGNGPNNLNPQYGSIITGSGGLCVYKGVTYKQSQVWSDGCNYKCECVDAVRGNYKCTDRCPQYFFLPPQCSYVTDSRDACCQQARCNPSAFLTPSPGSFVTPTPAPNGNLTNVTPTNGGVFGGSGLPPSPSPSFGSFSNKPTHTLNPHTVGGIGGSGTPPVRHTTYDIFTGTRPPNTCVYKDGTLHTKGQTWANGCKETCTCQDSVTNDIRCNQRCPVIAAIPSFCHMVQDPQDTCCKKPSCNYQGTPLTPMIGNKQPTTSPTLSPSITNVLPIGTHAVFSGSGHPPGTVYSTSMGGRDVCVYNGVMHRPGETWDDGCKFTCTCQIKGNGLYSCSDKCPTFPPLPSYCQFIPVVGQCCPSLHCDVPNVGQYHPVPQLNPSLTPNISPGQTPTMQPTNSPQLIVGPGQGNVFGGSGQPGHGSLVPSNPTIVGGINDKCIYKNKMYNQGEKWDDGCQYTCTCIESQSGFYKCLPKCPTYSKSMLPNGCYMTHAVGQCCETPVCSKPDGSIVNPLLQPNVYPVFGSFSGGFTGFRPGYTPGISATYGGRIDACVYKGSLYSQGQRWTDACDYDCECIDSSVGQYRCTPKCPTYTKLPPMCKSLSVANKCCPQVSCQGQNTTPKPAVTTPSGVTGPCVDVLPNCELYEDSSCKAPYEDWAKKNCARRCGICYTPPPSTVCRDKLDNCASYGKPSCSGQYQQWAKVNCQKYCDLCPNTGVSSTPPAGCADKLNNCKAYSSYSCSGQYEQWARTNCASTCGYCPTGTGVNQGHGGGVGVPATGWTILMKGVAGVPGDLYQLWASPNTASANVPSAQYLTSTYPHSYKPDLSNHWNDCNFDHIKVGIFNNGVEKASIVFDAHGADKMSWFDPSRIISSTWSDIKTAQKSIFSMMGDPMTGREFYTSGQSGSSCDASGWMMISTRPGCSYETKGAKPAFYYVPGTTQAKFSQTQLGSGDVFAILAQGGQCIGSTNPPLTGFTSNSQFCVYKGSIYKQGDTWLDGCEYNCTCQDASSGVYKCINLCPVYQDLPASCKMVKQPGECCAKPNCTNPAGATCFYKGKYYTQGQTWDDGCDYKCTCMDASKSFYQCTLKCLQWQLPKVCNMLAPPAGKCCPIPNCPPGYVINYPPNYVQE
ncbi:uncharacterized protein [Haliotis cracherodii]|uniref:uncharacterized protein n=1 Tax=Haliotis cracherodii TaxID=6455 RepID=UPI0039E824A5